MKPKQSTGLFDCTGKTSNICNRSTKQHKKLFGENVTKAYKKYYQH